MQKVTVAEEGQMPKSCMVTATETPNRILKYYAINPETKIVYMNGKILSKEDMKKPIKAIGNIFLSVKNKTVIRA